MPAYEIPLTAEPQRFYIALAGVTYQLTITWNPTTLCWVLDIASEDGTAILLGIPIITGLDLLAQYGYLGFGGSLVVQTDGSSSLTVEIDGNSTVPVVGPGAWFVVGSSVIGGSDAVWGPSGETTGTSGPSMQANIFPNDVPTVDNLGGQGKLFFVVSP